MGSAWGSGCVCVRGSWPACLNEFLDLVLGARFVACHCHLVPAVSVGGAAVGLVLDLGVWGSRHAHAHVVALLADGELRDLGGDVGEGGRHADHNGGQHVFLLVEHIVQHVRRDGHALAHLVQLAHYLVDHGRNRSTRAGRHVLLLEHRGVDDAHVGDLEVGLGHGDLGLHHLRYGYGRVAVRGINSPVGLRGWQGRAVALLCLVVSLGSHWSSGVFCCRLWSVLGQWGRGCQLIRACQGRGGRRRQRRLGVRSVKTG